jgi:hypothetical protein
MKKAIFLLMIMIFTIVSCKNNENQRNFENTDSTSTAKGGTGSIVRKASAVDKSIFRKDSSAYKLEKDTIQITIEFQQLDSINIKFKIRIREKIQQTEDIAGTATLIREQDDDGKYYLPEGTAIEGENTGKDYSCDSTYSYESDRISLGFGFERQTKKLLSFTIDSSTIEFISNNNYTLYKIF